MKSAVFVKIVALLALSTLGACDSDDFSLPHVFGANEVPPEVRAAPRAVMVPEDGSEADLTWMRLGDVPSMPKDFSHQQLIDQTKSELNNNGTEADYLKHQAESR